MPIWLIKLFITRIFKWLKRYSDMKKLDRYVNKPNELDKQMKQVQKNNLKNGKSIEEMEKDIAILKSDSHPPIFGNKDFTDILKRLDKIEKKE